MIIHLQNLANQLPDAFVDTKKVTKSHIPAANVPARVDITEGQKAFESKTRSKRGRPIGSKDITPRKRRTNGSKMTMKSQILKTKSLKRYKMNK